MKLIKRLIIGIVALLVLIIVGALVALQFVDKTEFIAQAKEQVKAKTGRDVTLSEDVSIGLGYAGGIALHPSVTLRDVTFSNSKWSENEHMFTAGEVGVGVSVFPFLSGEVAVDYVTLRDAVVNLEKNAQSKANWEFDAPKNKVTAAEETAAAIPEETESKGDVAEVEAVAAQPPSFSFDTVTLENITLRYQETAAGTDETVTLKRADISGAGELDAVIEAAYKGLAIDLNATADSLAAAMEKRVTLDLEVKGRGADIDVKGNVAPKGEAIGFEGDIDLAIENLAKLSELAPGLPETAPIAFSAKVNGTPKGANVKDGALNYAGQDVRLNLDADMSGTVPAITFDVKADRLDVAKFTPKKEQSESPKGAGDAGAPKATKASPRAAGSNAGMIPDVPLPLGVVAGLPIKAQGNIEIGELVQDAVTLKQVKLALDVEPGALSAKLSPLTVANGSLNGVVSMKVKSATSGTTSITLNASKLNVEQLIRMGGNDAPTISDGEMTMVLTLAGAGDTLPKMLGSANGKTSLLLNGASYNAPAIEQLKAFLTFLGGGKKVDEINIACAFADADISSGVMKTKVMTLQTDAAQVDGAGDVSFKNETLNMTLKPRSSMVGLADLAPPLKLSGKWSSPSVSVDEQSALLSLGKLALGAGTGGIGLALLGGEELVEKSDVFKNNPCVKQAQTAAPQPEKQKPEAALKEVGKNIENQVKSIRDAFEGKPSEPGGAKKGKEERIMDGLNAVKGLFGQ